MPVKSQLQFAVVSLTVAAHIEAVLEDEVTNYALTMLCHVSSKPYTACIMKLPLFVLRICVQVHQQNSAHVT